VSKGPPLRVIVCTLPLRRRVHRSDYTDRGDTPIEPPQLLGGAESYLSAVRALVERIIDRYGGAEEFDRFVSSHLDGLPADASVATLARGELPILENAIIEGDMPAAMVAVARIERLIASPWTGFNRSTGFKSGQARKRSGAEVRRAQFDAIADEAARLRQLNPHLSESAAIARAARKFNRSRAWFYRWKKLFSDP
jgi:hypothetical protein